MLNKNIQVIQAVLGAPGIDVNRLDSTKRSPIDIVTNPEVINCLILAGARSSKARQSIDVCEFTRRNRGIAVQMINGSINGKRLGTETESLTLGPYNFGILNSYYIYEEEEEEYYNYYEIGGKTEIGKPKDKH